MAEVYNKERKGDLQLYALVNDLKDKIESEGISFNELARRSGVSNATVSRIFTYKTYPSFGALYEMYKAVNLEINITVTDHNPTEEN